MPLALSLRVLNPTFLARQLLLDRAPMTAERALEHLGLQAQNRPSPYQALHARLARGGHAALRAAGHDATWPGCGTGRGAAPRTGSDGADQASSSQPAAAQSAANRSSAPSSSAQARISVMTRSTPASA